MLAVALCLLLQSAMPKLLHRVEPEYSEEARKVRLNGSVAMSVVVQSNGEPGDVRVLRSLGLGLDEKAIAAVSQWRFQPGTRDGQPVNIRATVEVNFRLLPGRDLSADWYTRSLTFQTPANAARPAVETARFMRPSGQEEGSVTLSFLIDEEGHPTAPRVENSAPASLEGEALSMLRGWEFKPAIKDGKPVAVAATIEFVFGVIRKPGTPVRPPA